MGYLSNSGTITVDAILTKKGRELLAKGQGTFNITQFALSDDEVDYDLWNPQHGLGSDYFGIVIENMPVTEAVPDETQSMKYKLITLPAGTKAIPYLTVGENLTSIQIYGAQYNGGTNATTGVQLDVEKLVNIYTNQYTGQQATLRMDNEVQDYTITILDSTYIELNASALNTTKTPSMSGNSITYSMVKDTGTGSSKSMQFTVKGKLLPSTGVETTKSTKIIITNEKYGSRLVLPVSYTF
jgi:hypothetical protein